ncbi:MAG TPA: alpha/beta hydrolase [Candidatus Saccharimonadia bacterium]
MKVVILHAIQSNPSAHWLPWLKKQLEEEHIEVVIPELSAPDHPDRAQWLADAKAAIGSVDPDELILVGHSLGVTTALDYLEQAEMPVRGLVSTAGFYQDYGNELNSYFLKTKAIDMQVVRHHLTNAFVFYGDNDPYVTQEALRAMADGLLVDPVVIKGGGHLNDEAGYTSFPQLFETVMELIDTPSLDFFA